jgi:hypothetical protein
MRSFRPPRGGGEEPSGRDEARERSVCLCKIGVDAPEDCVH